MPRRERVSKERSNKRPQEQQSDAEPQEKAKVDTEALRADLDDILDEIDEVLEENAEEFVKDYVQKGGQLWDAEAMSPMRRDRTQCSIWAQPVRRGRIEFLL